MTWFGSLQWVITTDGFGCVSGVILQHTNTVGRCTERKVGVSTNLAKVISDRNMGGALPLCVVFPRLAVSRLEGVWWILIP